MRGLAEGKARAVFGAGGATPPRVERENYGKAAWSEIKTVPQLTLRKSHLGHKKRQGGVGCLGCDLARAGLMKQ